MDLWEVGQRWWISTFQIGIPGRPWWWLGGRSNIFHSHWSEFLLSRPVQQKSPTLSTVKLVFLLWNWCFLSWNWCFYISLKLDRSINFRWFFKQGPMFVLGVFTFHWSDSGAIEFGRSWTRTHRYPGIPDERNRAIPVGMWSKNDGKIFRDFWLSGIWCLLKDGRFE